MDMMEQQELEAQEAIMPEGYGEGDDYFQEEDWGCLLYTSRCV